MKVEDFDLSNLIPCRKIAFDNATELKIVLFSGKYWDLLAFYNDQWHYIKTIKH